MFRSSLFRNPALKIVVKKDITSCKNVRCIACMCRPPRKKFVIRKGNLSVFNRHTEPKSLNFRFYCDYPSHYKVLLPALSPTMESGTIISWEKKEGDKLNEGDLLAEIETDKATMGFETPEEGYLAKIIVPAGTKNVPVGKLVCIIVENEADLSSFKNYVDTETPETPSSPAPKKDITPTPPPPAPPSPSPSVTPASHSPPAHHSQPSSKIYASPLAKKIAKEQGLSLDNIGKGSGIFGSLKSKDLTKVAESVKIEQLPSMDQDFQDMSISNIRNVIAKRLVQSKQTVPHYYLSVDINIDNMLNIRKKINSYGEKDGIKLSVNDFVIKAVAMACKKVPEANSSWRDTFIRQYNSVDISIAVSTNKGLITPIIFKADTKGLAVISQEIRGLAARAREGKLLPHEFQGGTISVSNLGMFDISNFSAIINPPQACILAVGSIEKRIVPDSKSESSFKTSEFLPVTLSCDHRVLDGAVGAQWLSAFRKYLENPDFMLL